MLRSVITRPGPEFSLCTQYTTRTKFCLPVPPLIRTFNVLISQLEFLQNLHFMIKPRLLTLYLNLLQNSRPAPSVKFFESIGSLLMNSVMLLTFSSLQNQLMGRQSPQHSVSRCFYYIIEILVLYWLHCPGTNIGLAVTKPYLWTKNQFVSIQRLLQVL